ncbi:MAG: thiamine pyrophosphate-dependent enzyme [Candidatus Dormiibacterota bacterium]
MPSVREVTFQLAAELGLRTWFGNPGSTEIPLLADFPDYLHYVLALHENAAVGMAAGYALASRQAQLVSLHTAAGLGNAVSALATARVNRAPLVVLVGQQDRRHIEFEPFLTGHLEKLAGDYPVSVHLPLRAESVPGALARARLEALEQRGPSLVIVPMDDWGVEMDDTAISAPQSLVQARSVPAPALTELRDLLAASKRPVLVTGAGADTREAWDALVKLADQLNCPVWQEPFTAQAGFPQDLPRFQGFLPAGRSGLRETLAAHDLVLVVGAAALRQYHFEPGPLFAAGTVAAVITDEPAEANRSPARLAVLGPIAAICEELAQVIPARGGPAPAAITRPAPKSHDGAGPLTPRRVFAALAARLDRDTIVVEESPSSRDDLQLMLPAREPLGYLSAAMGGLGFALPASIGLRMADPGRPVVALVGDGSAIYGIQALWSAVHYQVGALFIVLDNGSYGIMDRLASRQGQAPWPNFSEVRLDQLADGLGCPARDVADMAELVGLLDDVIPTLRERTEPLLINVSLTGSEETDP